MIFYTDGACSGNPGPGGFGVVGYDNSETTLAVTHQEFSDNTTNNREELKAILYALENFGDSIDPLTNDAHIVYSDSSYAVNTVNIWMYAWATNDWRRSNGKIPENLDIIKNIYNLNKQGNRIRLLKVAGHNGVKGNELADQLATGKKIIHKGE